MHNLGVLGFSRARRRLLCQLRIRAIFHPGRVVSARRGRLSDCPCCQTRPGRPISPPASSSMNACDGLTWRAFGWRFGLPVGLFVLETPPTRSHCMVTAFHGSKPPSAGTGALAIPPNHRMNVIGYQRARRGFGANKIGKDANVRDDLFPVSRSSLPYVGSQLLRSFCQGRISTPRS
jgi:hypothetical protein